MEIYRVGGAVRDELLGLPVSDQDWVVTGATPEQMLAHGFRQVGIDFPVFLHPDTHEEYALARTERKTAPGYHGFAVDAAPAVTLEQDLSRRDLTINAMARDAAGNLIDPYGGQADLEQRLLRHVSPAFAEDPLRILRVARFAARFHGLGFRIAPETQALMQQMVAAGEAEALVAERVWVECQRALCERYPGQFISVLRDCGALAVLLPELDRLFGVPQPEQHHPEIDTGIHSLMVLEQAVILSDEPQVRFAALVHDVGKGETPTAEWPAHIAHEQRSVKLIEQLCRRLRVPKDYRELAVLVARYHTQCHRAFELKPATVLKMLESVDALRRPERFEQFLLACEADARGRLGFEHREYPQAQRIRQACEVAVAVPTQPLLERGLRDQALADELRQQRIRAISELLI
jgi:tRNA nucleotidyltransferase (CCA-adding enzyme)